LRSYFGFHAGLRGNRLGGLTKGLMPNFDGVIARRKIVDHERAAAVGQVDKQMIANGAPARLRGMCTAVHRDEFSLIEGFALFLSGLRLGPVDRRMFAGAGVEVVQDAVAMQNNERRAASDNGDMG